MQKMNIQQNLLKLATTAFVVATFFLPSSLWGQQAKEPNRGGEVDLRSLDTDYALKNLKVP